MTGFFDKMSSGLTTGWNLLSSAISYPFRAQAKFTSQHFPYLQKKVITGSEVSVTPYVDYVGYRPQVKGAVTTGNVFKEWWDKAYKSGQSIWDGVRKGFGGYDPKLPQTAIKTATAIVTKTAGQLVATLPDYFMQKWGLKEREYSGEVQSNTPVYKANIYYPNPTQSNAPATMPSLADFWGIMQGNQPQGEYLIGFPQSAPIPSTVETSTPGGMNLGTLLLIGAVIFGGLYLFRKRAA